MSGGREFSPERFRGAVVHILGRHGTLMPASKLAWIIFHADFEAYGRLGQSITGATYLKGRDHPEVLEAGVGWFERCIRALLPWWARAGGWLVVLYAFKVSWGSR